MVIEDVCNRSADRHTGGSTRLTLRWRLSLCLRAPARGGRWWRPGDARGGGGMDQAGTYSARAGGRARRRTPWTAGAPRRRSATIATCGLCAAGRAWRLVARPDDGHGVVESRAAALLASSDDADYNRDAVERLAPEDRARLPKAIEEADERGRITRSSSGSSTPQTGERRGWKRAAARNTTPPGSRRCSTALASTSPSGARRGGAAGRGSAQGRVPRDARARAAQSARADRATRSQILRSPAPTSGRSTARARSMERQVAAAGAPGRRPAGRRRASRAARSSSRRAASTCAVVDRERGRDQPAADRRRGPRARSSTLPREPICVDADPTRLAQVLREPAQQRREVHATAAARSGSRSTREAPTVVVAVRDNGIGIAPRARCRTSSTCSRRSTARSSARTAASASG